MVAISHNNFFMHTQSIFLPCSNSYFSFQDLNQVHYCYTVLNLFNASLSQRYGFKELHKVMYCYLHPQINLFSQSRKAFGTIWIFVHMLITDWRCVETSKVSTASGSHDWRSLSQDKNFGIIWWQLEWSSFVDIFIWNSIFTFWCGHLGFTLGI